MKIIRIDADSLSYAAKKIKKELQADYLKHNTILNLLSEALYYKDYNDYLEKMKDYKNEDIEIDLADIDTLNQRIAMTFESHGKISPIPYLKKEKEDQIKMFLKVNHDFNICDYIRIYNQLNNRKINNGKEIVTYIDIENILLELLNDLEFRFKDIINITENDLFPKCDICENNNQKESELILFSNNRNNDTSNLIFKIIYYTIDNNKEKAFSLLKNAIKDVFIEHQEESDEMFIFNIKKFPIKTIKKDDEILKMKYLKAAKKSLFYMGTKKTSKYSFQSIKETLSNDSSLLFNENKIGKHILINGDAGSGLETLRLEYVIQNAMRGIGFIYFVENTYDNYSNKIKNALKIAGNGDKLIHLTTRQFLKLRESEINSFISKNKMVLITLKETERLNPESLMEQENKLINIFDSISKNSQIKKSHYIISIVENGRYSANYFNQLKKYISLFEKNNILLIMSLFSRLHFKDKKIDKSFRKLFYYCLLLSQQEYNIIKKNEFDITISDLNSLNKLNFYLLKDNKIEKNIYYYKPY